MSVFVSMSEFSPLINELILMGKDVKFLIVGNSMYPILRNNFDSVLLSKPKEELIKKYAVILYKRESGQHVVHRIMKVRGDVLYLCGDNQMTIEYPIYKNQVVSVVSGIFRGEKFIPVTNFWYKAYSFLWVNLFFFRKPIMKISKLIVGLFKRN